MLSSIRTSISVALVICCAWPWPGAEAQPASTQPAREIVDEPLGARYSLGMTLWRLGHDPQMIARFHDYLKAKGLKPEDLLAPDALQPPAKLTQLLLEPELLDKEQLGGWAIDKDYITSAAGDAGPTVSLPLQTPRAGFYRLWIQY